VLAWNKLMKNVTVVLVAVGLVLLLANTGAAAERIMAPPGAPVVPQWAPIPQVPGVEYAPNIEQDLFRHQGGFYNYQGGGWFRGITPTGPWVPVPAPPQVFYNIQAPYFKSPPGWAKGKKTGWGGAPMPPGQMKKNR
jgi:hypothetical protein